MNQQLIVIQATPFCNINCRYCYLPNRSSTRRINTQTLSRIAEALFTSSYVMDDINILWHAGEPLTMPISFYEHAVELFNRANSRNAKIEFTVQTNATLINQQWCDFFKRHNFYVGVSIDGPEEVHNANRLDRAGKGSFERVMRGIRLLQQNDIPVNVIMVVTSHALDIAEQIWRFFINNKIYNLAFNPEEVEGVNTVSSIYTTISLRKYHEFLDKIADLRQDTEIPVSVRELDVFEHRIRHGSGEVISSLNTPFHIISFDCDGNVSTFCPELLTSRHARYGDFVLGNVTQHSLDEILKSEKFRKINEEIQRGKAKCAATCEYFSVCGGGSPSNKLWENNTFESTETMNCRFNVQIPCNVVLSRLECELHLA